MQLSARNQMKGVVAALHEGVVNVEVVIELPGGQQVVSIITKAACESLGLSTGKSVYAVVKASNVIVATD